MEESFIYYIESSIKENWDRPALTDYHGINCNYKDVARKIEKLHILFEHAGWKRQIATEIGNGVELLPGCVEC